jgi:hypothetical protein
MGLKLMQFSAAGLMYFYAGNDRFMPFTTKRRPLSLSADQKRQLESLRRSRAGEKRRALHAAILLDSASGMGDWAVAHSNGVNRQSCQGQARCGAFQMTPFPGFSTPSRRVGENLEQHACEQMQSSRDVGGRNRFSGGAASGEAPRILYVAWRPVTTQPSGGTKHIARFCSGL